MTRIPVLTKPQILEAAFTLLNEYGMEKVTIRSIAKQLGKSIAPIYTQYKTMDMILNDLKGYCNDQLIAYTKKQYEIDPFLNIGVGIIDFALNNKKAFSYYYLASNEALFETSAHKDEFLSQMKSNDMLTVLDDERLLSLLDEMWIYTYGLATSICTGVFKDKPLEYFVKRLGNMGSNLISYHLYSTGSYEAYIHKFLGKVSQHVSIEEVLKS